MNWLYRHLYRNEKGFTLVELMIVIIILAILTGIAVPSYMVLRTRAREAAAKAELMNIATALEMYQVDKEAYPITSSGIAALAPVYMSVVPTTDPWGTAPYAYDSDGTTYKLTCNSPTEGALNITNGQPDW